MRWPIPVSEVPKDDEPLIRDIDLAVALYTTAATICLLAYTSYKPPETKAADPPQASDDDDQDKGGFWRNPVTATLAVLGFAVLLGFLVDELDDDDDDDSPSNP